MTTTAIPRDWSVAHDPGVVAANQRQARRVARPSVIGVIGAIGRNLAARASSATPTLLEVGGLGAVTYGAYTWQDWAGWVVGGVSALLLSAKLGSGEPPQ